MELLEGSVQDNTPVLSLGFSIPAPIGAELKQSDGNTNVRLLMFIPPYNQSSC